MMDARKAVEVLQQAAGANLDDPIRQGSVLVFPDYGQVVMTGDLHGHRRNFAKLKKYCNLEQFGARHVMLHELIHEDVQTLNGCDTSFELLLDAAQWKCDFPDQVHFLLSNHELAQINGHEISKNGRVVTRDFDNGVFEAYGQDADAILKSIDLLIRSFPLAGRTPNRVFLSHSLPSPLDLPTFDATALSARADEVDLSERGTAHKMVWGRYQTQQTLDVLAELLDVDLFICGHQPQESGFGILHERMIILASEHNHGVFLPLDLSKPASLERLSKNIRPFAGVM